MVFCVVHQAVVLHSCISLQKQMLLECYPNPILSDSILGSVQILRSHLSFLSNHDSDDGSFYSRERSLYKPLCILPSLPDRDYSSALNKEPGAQREGCNAFLVGWC